MRFISTRTHAVLDYLGGLLLIGVPMFWMNRPDIPPAALITPMVIGAAMLLQALFTDYEISLVDAIPMPAHLGMDAVAGVVLAASPWLFGFSDVVWIPHVVLGLMEIGAAMTTQWHRTEPRGMAGRGTRLPT